MKNTVSNRKTVFLFLFFMFLFLFSSNLAQASENSFDICESKFKDNFKTICEKDNNLPNPWDIFKAAEKDAGGISILSSKRELAEAQEYQDDNGDGINDEDEIIIKGNEEWTGNKFVDGKFVFIEPDARLEIKEGATITLRNSIIYVEGKLAAEGTSQNPVIFKALETEDGYGFLIFSGFGGEEPQGEIAMAHVDMSGIGGPYEYDWDDPDSIPLGLINVWDAKLDVEESSFHDALNAILLDGNNPEEKTVKRSKFYDNRVDIANACYKIKDEIDPDKPFLESIIFPDLRYNYFEALNNPENVEKYDDDEYGHWEIYKNIWGIANFKPWFVSEDFFDPVIIIPGILGSEEEDGKLQLDPVWHTYDDLYDEFVEEGFSPEKNLFTFPYEWRNSNQYNALLLRDKIAEIKQSTGYSRVDIVAHSMGGLLAREYIESDYYEDDVDQLITLGTPNNGAPNAYIKWEAGEFLFDIADIYLKHRFSQEAEENGYEDIFHYIKNRPILSIKELLPVYSYLYEAQNSDQLREYPDNYPINDFLENLNLEENIKKLKSVLFYKIIGNTESNKTAVGFKVVNTDMGEYWINGYPLGFEIPTGSRGFVMGNGDETVPLESAKSENIPADETTEIDSDHLGLPTNAQSDVLEILNGIKPESEVKHNLLKKIFIILVHSPVDVQIIDPNGQKVGKNFETGERINEIEGAFYSGSGAQNEFLTIPNPADGEYKILTQGTGEGEYKIEAVKITEDETTRETKELTATIEGETSAGKEEEAKIDVREEEINVIEKDTMAPEITIVSPEENKTYPNNKTISISYEITDDKSSSDSINTQIFLDGTAFSGKSLDLSLQNLGEHSLEIIAKDEAGNEAQKEVKFKIETDTQAIAGNINHYFSLGFIKNRFDKSILISQIKTVRQLEMFMKIVERDRFLSDRTKESLKKLLEKQINQQLDFAINYVKMRSNPKIKDGIDAKIAELLIESFKFVKYNF